MPSVFLSLVYFVILLLNSMQFVPLFIVVDIFFFPCFVRCISHELAFCAWSPTVAALSPELGYDLLRIWKRKKTRFCCILTSFSFLLLGGRRCGAEAWPVTQDAPWRRNLFDECSCKEEKEKVHCFSFSTFLVFLFFFTKSLSLVKRQTKTSFF